ncbi:MAG: universal stress protein [Deltaproteobacteria bacterium]|nr:MAG: universal stress protein [Deltaproteobacteria bacterium]
MLNFIKKIQGKKRDLEEKNPRQDAGPDQETRPKPEVPRKILVVGKGETPDVEVMDYAVNLAERLGYDLIALSVNTALGQKGRLFTPYKYHLRKKFAQRARDAGEALRKKAALKGVGLEQVVKCGDLRSAVAEVHRQSKRIEFVITQDGIKEKEVNGDLNIPVFSITGYQGERAMAKDADSRGSGLIGKTVGFGLATAVLYAAVFMNTDTVMQYFTKGAWYAALPIATVFVFSFVHGAFSGYLWEALGIQAPKKVQPRPAAAKRPVARKRPRPELRINT